MNWIQTIVFSLLIFWEKCKHVLRWVQYQVSRYFTESKPLGNHKLGQNAPQVNSMPKQLVKPLHTRIVKVVSTSQGSVTNEFIDAMSLHNMLHPRQDLFYSTTLSSIFNFSRENPLFVCYKQGMKHYQVPYKSVVLFPPSEAAASGKRRLADVVFVNNTNSKEMTNVLDVFVAFSGPAGDFYLGSDYEVTFYDIFMYLYKNTVIDMDFEHIENYSFIIYMDNVNPFKVDAIDETAIQEILKQFVK